MKYIIMSDGKMTRWKEKHNIPKHLMKVNGETLLERIVRQIKSIDKEAEVIITSHNNKYEVEGAERYEPLNNKLEIDRFTYELIDSDCCFLYGDTFYTDNCIRMIMNSKTKNLMFYGNNISIVALVVKNEVIMKSCIHKVRNDFINGAIKECKGWQLYYQYLRTNQSDDCFTRIDDKTQGFNIIEEYQEFIGEEFA